jgi:hypothetical protein
VETVLEEQRLLLAKVTAVATLWLVAVVEAVEALVLDLMRLLQTLQVTVDTVLFLTSRALRCDTALGAAEELKTQEP